jgi:hydroxymethylglutaryl-CoA lyase
LSEIKLGLVPAIISKYIVREWAVSFSREAILTGREVTPEELHQFGVVCRVCKDPQALEQTVDEYLDSLGKCAPRSAAICKELVRLGWVDAGGMEQAAKVEKTFGEMMAPGSEGRFGIEQFQKKVRGIDWGSFYGLLVKGTDVKP